MKVLVVFDSETGNTEKIARAIYEEASREHEAHFKRADEIEVGILNDYDVVFLGSACHSTDLTAPAKRILEDIPVYLNLSLLDSSLTQHPQKGSTDGRLNAHHLFIKQAEKRKSTSKAFTIAKARPLPQYKNS